MAIDEKQRQVSTVHKFVQEYQISSLNLFAFTHIAQLQLSIY